MKFLSIFTKIVTPHMAGSLSLSDLLFIGEGVLSLLDPSPVRRVCDGFSHGQEVP